MPSDSTATAALLEVAAQPEFGMPVSADRDISKAGDEQRGGFESSVASIVGFHLVAFFMVSWLRTEPALSPVTIRSVLCGPILGLSQSRNALPP